MRMVAFLGGVCIIRTFLLIVLCSLSILFAQLCGTLFPTLELKRLRHKDNELLHTVQMAYPYAIRYLSEIPCWIFPYCNNLHFSVFVIDTLSKGCYILDSLSVGEEKAAILSSIGIRIQDYIAPFMAKIKGVDEMDFEWKVLSNCSKQPDGFSCGIFACKFMEHYTHLWGGNTFPQLDWEDPKVLIGLKRNICVDLIAQPDNLLLPTILTQALQLYEGTKRRVYTRSKNLAR